MTLACFSYPPEILALPGPLDETQRQLLQDHCRQGTELLAPLGQDLPWLAEAAFSHHERIDGSGYPHGLRQNQVSSLTRLLAVCVILTPALCSPRPYRPARDTRTRSHRHTSSRRQGIPGPRPCRAFCCNFRFYPLGAAVEMADGSIGVVVAAPRLRRDLAGTSPPGSRAAARFGGSTPVANPGMLIWQRSISTALSGPCPFGNAVTCLGSSHPEWVAA